jgi:hypothetical protein
MKKLIYLSAFLGLLAFSCSDDSKPIRACNVDDVLELPWLRDRIEMYEAGDHTITMGTYNSQTVFVAITCCAVCNMAPPAVYDCNGGVIGTIGYDNIQLEEITDKKIVWRSADDSCGM